MMSLDGQAVLASGPSQLQVGSWQRRLIRRELPGLDGELVLDLGARGRPLVVTGRLQADNAQSLDGQVQAITVFQDGTAHELIDNHGLAYANVMILDVALTTPMSVGRGVWVDYRMEMLQLP